MFILIGAQPGTGWLDSAVACDGRGCVLTGNDVLRQAGVWPLARPPHPTETSFPGLFAAGDVRASSVKRVASAVGDGSITVQYVHQHLQDQQ